MTTILDVARRAAINASAVCTGVLQAAPAEPDAMAKLGKEPVTLADYGSQAVILATVADEFPDHGVIAEEGAEHLRASSGDLPLDGVLSLVGAALGRPVGFEQMCEAIDHTGGGAEYTWVVDPIDGTKGFLRRQQFAVAIGVMRNGIPYAGALGCPHLSWPGLGTGVVLWAEAGGGAFVQTLDGSSEVVRIATSSATVGDARMLGSVEAAHGDPALVTAVVDRLGMQETVRMDSQAKYAAVAGGLAEVYLRPRSRPDYRENIWDHLAGVVVVEAAGGRVTDLDGKGLDFALGRKLEANRGVVATNGAVHDEVLDAIAFAEATTAA